MIGGRRAQQVAVEPRARFEQVGKRQLRLQAELEGDIAELHVEVDQAGFAADAPASLLREADRELAQQRRRADPADALDHADQLGRARRPRAWRACRMLVADRRQRGFKLFDVERQRNDVVRAGADQRSDERQRRIVGRGDQRRLGRLRRASGSA